MDHHTHNDAADLADLLDLDAEVLHSYLSDVTEWIGLLAADRPSRRILDLGAGTGTGTIALAQRFAGAQVIAVDSSAEMLSRVRAKALDLGLADRVVTVQADLDAAWPAIEPVDVTWASLSLHHLADPDRVLKEVLATLHPGGLFAALEMDGPLRFLPDDVGAGLEARCHAALAEEHTAAMPNLGSDWGARLEQAGFVSINRRTFTIDLKAPLSTEAARYARESLRRFRPALDRRLGAADLAALDTLIDSDGPEGLLHRNDLNVRGSRTVWVAHRS